MLPVGELPCELNAEASAKADAEAAAATEGTFSTGRSILGLIVVVESVPRSFRCFPVSFSLSLSLSLRINELMRSFAALDLDLRMVAAGSAMLSASDGGVTTASDDEDVSPPDKSGGMMAAVVLLSKSAPRSWSEGNL